MSYGLKASSCDPLNLFNPGVYGGQTELTEEHRDSIIY